MSLIIAMVGDGICVLLEVKTTLLRIETRCYFEEEALRAEVKGGSLKKAIQQLSVFENAILTQRIGDERLTNIERVISVIVGYEDIYVLNSSLLPLLQEEYGVMAADLQLATISDIDAIGCILAEQKDLGKLIAEKIDTPGSEWWSIEAWLRQKITSDNPILSVAFNAFLSRMGFDDTLK